MRPFIIINDEQVQTSHDGAGAKGECHWEGPGAQGPGWGASDARSGEPEQEQGPRCSIGTEADSVALVAVVCQRLLQRGGGSARAT